jgi:hypothetical protein
MAAANLDCNLRTASSLSERAKTGADTCPAKGGACPATGRACLAGLSGKGEEEARPERSLALMSLRAAALTLNKVKGGSRSERWRKLCASPLQNSHAARFRGKDTLENR